MEEIAGSCSALQKVSPDREEAARLERVVRRTNSRILNAADEKLVFEDEPAAFQVVLMKSRAS